MRILQKSALVFSTLLFITISACEEKSKNKKEEPQQDEPEMVKAPDGIITLNEAKILCDNYETRRIRGIKEFEVAQNPEKEFIPTQFINFDFKTIQRYVKYVERRAKKANVKPDSLRIYLANYGKDGKDPNRNTVFILPTTSINGEHGGFYIEANGNAKLIRNYWPKNGNGSQGSSPKAQAGFFPSLNTVLYQDGSLILNDGHSGPPPNTDF